MQRFELTYSENGRTVLVLVTIPPLFMFAAIGMLLSAGELPDWVVMGATFAALGAAIAVTLFVIKRYIAIPCELGVSPERLELRLLRPSPAYPFTALSCGWDNVSNVSLDRDDKHDRWFLRVSFREPDRTGVLMLPPDDGSEEPAVWLEVQSQVARFNTQHAANPTVQITKRGFYESGWAVALTWVAWILLIAVTAFKISSPEAVPTARVVQVYVFSFIWLSSYYVNRRRQGGGGGEPPSGA